MNPIPESIRDDEEQIAAWHARLSRAIFQKDIVEAFEAHVGGKFGTGRACMVKFILFFNERYWERELVTTK